MPKSIAQGDERPRPRARGCTSRSRGASSARTRYSVRNAGEPVEQPRRPWRRRCCARCCRSRPCPRGRAGRRRGLVDARQRKPPRHPCDRIDGPGRPRVRPWASTATFYTIDDSRLLPRSRRALELAAASPGRPARARRSRRRPDAGPEERLEPHVTLVELPGFDPGLPVLKKTFPDLLSPAGVVTQIDTDMIVTRLARAPARPGRVGTHRSLSRPRVQSRPLVRRMGGSGSASPDRLAARRT